MLTQLLTREWRQKRATHVAPTRVAVVQAIDSRKFTGMRATPTHSLGALTSIIAGKSPMNGKCIYIYICVYLYIIYIYNGSLKGEIIIIIKIWSKSWIFQQDMFEYQRVRENVVSPYITSNLVVNPSIQSYRPLYLAGDRFLPWHGGFLEVIPRVVVDENVILGSC